MGRDEAKNRATAQQANGAQSAGGQQPVGPTKTCKKCGAAIPKYSETCPVCGKNLKPFFKRAWFWVLVVLLLLVAFVGACSATAAKSISDNTNIVSTGNGQSGASSDNGQGSSQQSTGASKYTIEGETGATNSIGVYTVDGTFTNTTDKQMRSVVVTYTLKDASGNQVGSATASTQNLQSGTPWKFEAMGNPTGEVASFELASVEAF